MMARGPRPCLDGGLNLHARRSVSGPVPSLDPHTSWYILTIVRSIGSRQYPLKVWPDRVKVAQVLPSRNCPRTIRQALAGNDSRQQTVVASVYFDEIWKAHWSRIGRVMQAKRMRTKSDLYRRAGADAIQTNVNGRSNTEPPLSVSSTGQIRDHLKGSGRESAAVCKDRRSVAGNR